MTAEFKPHFHELQTRAELWLHRAAAFGAALCALAPFVHLWTLTVFGIPCSFRSWPGNLVTDAFQGVAALMGGVMGGGWWWWTAGVRSGRAGIAGTLLLVVVGIASLAGIVTPVLWLAFIAAMVTWGSIANFARPISRKPSMRDFFMERLPWNAAFFVIFVLLNIGSDVVMLRSSPDGWLPAAGFILSRALLHVATASIIWSVLLLYQRWAPHGLRWPGWVAVALAPVFVALDLVIRLAWKKGLLQLCDELIEEGSVNIFHALEGGGVQITPLHSAATLAVLSAAAAFFAGCGWISRRRGWRASPWSFFRAAGVSWMLLLAVQFAQHLWAAPEWKSWEDRSCSLRFTPFAAQHGLVNFDVTIANPVITGHGGATKKPDVYFFIIETLRADALRPDVAPFLSRWRDEECQKLGDTRSASNATHLSWFSMLHGRLPVFEPEARLHPECSPLLQKLHDSGWRVEVRDAGTFEYHEMHTIDFGDRSALSVFEHVPADHPERKYGVSEREVRMMERLQKAVTASPAGGVLRLTAIDSTHYPYTWGPNWTPPIKDYEKNPLFPPLPTDEEVRRVLRRYWNSVAWVDHLLADFVSFLKQTGRYDDAVIIVTGDHGEEFKEHGSWFHCSGVNREQTNVPILIKWPASWGGSPAQSDASHLDLVPTLLHALGFPEESWKGMPGRPLRKDGGSSSIVATQYAGESREAMLWRRDGYEAAFSWDAPWAGTVPQRVWLERLEGPDGLIKRNTPAEYEAELRLHFADAFTRAFEKCERVEK